LASRNRHHGPQAAPKLDEALLGWITDSIYIPCNRLFSFAVPTLEVVVLHFGPTCC
jgi:hypothetical protein